MTERVGAYGTTAKTSDTSFRRNWDTEEYTAKAREKDREQRERAEQAEEYARKGKRPPKGTKVDLPKPTELMKAREAPLELDKNLNKTIIVSGASGAGQPGFFCDVCNKTSKDSVAYLDHINSRAHLRVLGQTTRVVRSTLNDVRQKIADLRAKTAASTESKQYDFDQRIKEIKALETASKLEAKEAKRKKKLMDEAASTEGQDQDMMKAMGFAGFT